MQNVGFFQIWSQINIMYVYMYVHNIQLHMLVKYIGHRYCHNMCQCQQLLHQLLLPVAK